MTIKELEERTGMTRANIRYYEQEGLLTPARKENGYRSYSPEDESALLKIKLLRQLDFSIQDILAMQRGELSLAAAMEERGIVLGQRSQELSRAQELCRTIGREVADYDSLDPARYLEQLNAPAQKNIQKDVPPVHPWRRYFARTTDLALASLVVIWISHSLLEFKPLDLPGLDFVRSLVAWIVLMVFEPLLIHFFSTTPGKWIFGIRVRARDGGQLGLTDAYSRTATVFVYGGGLGISILACACAWYSYDRYVDLGIPLAWEEESSLEFVDRSWNRMAAGYTATLLATLATGFFMMLSPLLPPHHGDLTVEQFSENYNFFREEMNLTSSLWLDDEGYWTDQPTGLSGEYRLSGQNHLEPQLIFQQEDGVITGVSYQYQETGDDRNLSAHAVPALLSWMALTTAHESPNRFQIYFLIEEMREWRQEGLFDPERYRDISFDDHGVTLDFSIHSFKPSKPLGLKIQTVNCSIQVD